MKNQFNRRAAIRTLGLGLPMALIAGLPPRASLAGQAAAAESKFPGSTATTPGDPKTGGGDLGDRRELDRSIRREREGPLR
jgi:hypothetical protein